MFSNAEIAEFLTDQMTEFVSLKSRKAPAIEPDLIDDEGATDRLLLNRWQDLRTSFRLSDRPVDWTEIAPIERWEFVDATGTAVRR